MSDISQLNHTSEVLKSGGEVIVLDTGAVISPESDAMLQALHSRSVGWLRSHLSILEAKGSDNFMKNFYVGYGHKSIWDCGSTTIFIEGVSMLAAKAVQDWALYSGQEASTRYIDFSRQAFLVAGKDQAVQSEITESYRAFYLKALEASKIDLALKHPRMEGEDEKVWEKAINARAFDITRGLLPAGASTNLAWHTNLRQAADKIALLRHHPLIEVQDIAHTILRALKRAHPNSFDHKVYESTEDYNASWVNQDYLYHNPTTQSTSIDFSLFDQVGLAGFSQVLKSRPPKTELPTFLADFWTIGVDFPIDFWSYRDLQRHRAVSQRMPLLTFDLGFHPWYIQNLPAHLQEESIIFLNTQKEATLTLNLSKEEMQYLVPMGYQVSCRLRWGLPAWIYLLELRSTHFVHPTLQFLAKAIGLEFRARFQESFPIYVDHEIGKFDVKRGTHDIVGK